MCDRNEKQNKNVALKEKRIRLQFIQEKETKQGAELQLCTACAPQPTHALSSFHSQSASGQSGDLRLSVVSSGGEDVFTALCEETQKTEIQSNGGTCDMSMKD